MTIYAWILFVATAVYFLFLLPTTLRSRLLSGIVMLIAIAAPIFYFANYLFFHFGIDNHAFSQWMLYYSVVLCAYSIFSFRKGGWINMLFFLPQIPFYLLILYPNLLSNLFN